MFYHTLMLKQNRITIKIVFNSKKLTRTLLKANFLMYRNDFQHIYHMYFVLEFNYTKV